MKTKLMSLFTIVLLTSLLLVSCGSAPTEAPAEAPTAEEPAVPAPTEAPAIHEGAWVEGTSFLDDINYHRMSDFLDISYEDRRDENIANKLAYLADWIKDTQKITDENEVRFAIHQSWDPATP